ncbi:MULTISPECIES: DapH/DapD/GlmU-related protein [Winogradskyella]|uniref:DapH/DapD/GlmU-related protein n=1 Tax=Winogradskyella TaxID=286104 RepID=UPI0015CBBB7C|nr:MULTISPECIES: DapH/DapD/GlmU-related protein [Winogradskyella]QXP80034.1 sulfotransferase domain-containing protein [Winogradskyella sp. HaHa_3_26]
MKKIINTIVGKLISKYRNDIVYYSEKVEKENEKNRIEFIIRNIPLVGDRLKVDNGLIITHPNNVVIGSNVKLGNNAYFDTIGGLIIGDNVSIGANVTVSTSMPNFNGALPHDKKFITNSVIIQKNVIIGMNVNIAPGITIGEGAIISSGISVIKDVPSLAIVESQSYHNLKLRDSFQYNLLKEKQIYADSDGKLFELNNLSKLSGSDLGGKLFFIVSTGRSGTTSLASILSQNPNINCRHEISNQLIKISTEYAHNRISRKRVLETIRGIYDNRVFDAYELLGESNQKLSNLIPLIHEALPQAKFIWLIRDGKKVVDSTYARGWYKNEIEDQDMYRDLELLDWDNYRLLGYKTNDFELEEWSKMSDFEKNCWYWVKWNSIIERDFQNLPKNQKLFIKLEEINEGINKMSNFLEIDDFVFKITKNNKAKHTLKGSENWSDVEIEQFETICGEFYRRYYDN